MASRRKVEIGVGFVRARECPGCGHTRCGESCTCNCDAEWAEHEAATLRTQLWRLRSIINPAPGEDLEVAASEMADRAGDVAGLEAQLEQARQENARLRQVLEGEGVTVLRELEQARAALLEAAEALDELGEGMCGATYGPGCDQKCKHYAYGAAEKARAAAEHGKPPKERL